MDPMGYMSWSSKWDGLIAWNCWDTWVKVLGQSLCSPISHQFHGLKLLQEMPKNLWAAGPPWPFVFDSCHFWVKNSIAKRDLAFGKAKVTRIMPNKMSQFSKHAGKSQPFGTHGQTVANQLRNRIQQSSSKHKKTIGQQPPKTSTLCKSLPTQAENHQTKPFCTPPGAQRWEDPQRHPQCCPIYQKSSVSGLQSYVFQPMEGKNVIRFMNRIRESDPLSPIQNKDNKNASETYKAIPTHQTHGRAKSSIDVNGIYGISTPPSHNCQEQLSEKHPLRNPPIPKKMFTQHPNHKKSQLHSPSPRHGA